MDTAAGDRGDIDDAAARLCQFRHQATRQCDRREEIDVEHPLPEIEWRIDGAQPSAGLVLGRDRGIVDQCIKRSHLVGDLLGYLAT